MTPSDLSLRQSGHCFRPIIVDPSLRWRSQPFDLKFDAKWTHQVGSVVSMNHTEDVIVRVSDRRSGAVNGMRFSTGKTWIRHAAGEWVRLSLATKSTTGEKVPFRAAYLPQDSAHSGFYEGVANASVSTLSFDFKIPGDSTASTHLVRVEPLLDEAAIAIASAGLVIL